MLVAPAARTRVPAPCLVSGADEPPPTGPARVRSAAAAPSATFTSRGESPRLTAPGSTAPVAPVPATPRYRLPVRVIVPAPWVTAAAEAVPLWRVSPA